MMIYHTLPKVTLITKYLIGSYPFQLLFISRAGPGSCGCKKSPLTNVGVFLLDALEPGNTDGKLMCVSNF